MAASGWKAGLKRRDYSNSKLKLKLKLKLKSTIFSMPHSGISCQDNLTFCRFQLR